jgi:Pup amidohydrolase
LREIFDRLVGLETEYAIRFQPTSFFAPRPARFLLYRHLVQALRSRVPLVRAGHFKEGVFTATGGALWFETERIASDGGLIEGATPECRGPRQVLTYQRGQDRLVAEAARDADVAGQFRLIKNCRDSRDNVYGAQENYEATLAGPAGLLAWRIGLVLMVPLVVLTWLSLLVVILGMLVYLSLAGIVYLVLRMLPLPHERIALAMFGRDLVEGRETGAPLPGWLEGFVIWAARLAGAPLAIALLVLARLIAFRRIRQQSLGFLVSRTVLGGAGMVDRAGRFQLADKAPSVNCTVGFGGYLWDRPIFNFGHFFKSLSLESFLAPGDYGALFHPRQRLQVGLGDSNMSEVAEYLRVGTTLLVLDAIEAGYLAQAPRIRRPIRWLHRICLDWHLQEQIPLTDGRHVTAVELQRIYLEACGQFVAEHPQAPREAWEVLQRWQDALDALENDPQELVGTLDWVTKKFLLDRAGRDADWAVRKKIDIRYHELSDEGYFQVLARTGTVGTLLDPVDIERAMRTPPPNTPATTRGQYIREFADADLPLTANWKRVVIGRGRAAKIVRLSRFRRRPEVG